MRLHLSFVFMLITAFSFAQPAYTEISRDSEVNTSSDPTLKELMALDIVTAGNIESYGIEFELVDYNFGGDSTILNDLSIQELYAHRLVDTDQEFIDLGHGITILLYSYEKALKRRKGLIILSPNKD